MVAHDIICFVEGGAQGHCERRGGKTDVCFPKRLCSVCGREAQSAEWRRQLADRQTDRQAGEQTGGDRKEGRQRLTDKQTYRERKADKLTDTLDNQLELWAHLGTLRHSRWRWTAPFSAILTVTNHKNSRVERNVLSAFSSFLQKDQEECQTNLLHKHFNCISSGHKKYPNC